MRSALSRIVKSSVPAAGLVALALPAAAGAHATGGTTAPSRAQIDALARAAGIHPLAKVFPVKGKTDFGTSENAFGGGRGHEGQDLLTDCGTPVVAARAGKVTVARWHDAAGNFVVVEAEDGTDQVYMHLLEPARVAVRDRVRAGDRLGVVGQTGRASTCHLHFEQWTAPGWYAGGRPVDPAGFLRRLAARG